MPRYESFEEKMVRVLDELLETRSLKDVTTSMLISEAGVSRSTFYRHFRDKQDVVQWHIAETGRCGLWEIGRTLSWREGVYATTVALKKYRNLSIKAAGESGYNSFLEYSIRTRRDNLIETLLYYKKMKIDVNLRYQIETVAFAGPAIMVKWCRDGMKEDTEDFVDAFISAMPKQLLDIMDS